MLFIHPSSNHRLWSLLYKLHFYHCFELEEGRNHSRKHRLDIKLVEQWEAWRFVCWWVGCWVRGGGFSEGVLPGRQCGITGHVQELCLWTHKCLFASTVCGWGNRHPSDSSHGGSCHSNSVFLFTVNSVVPRCFTLLSFSVVHFRSIFFGWLFSHSPDFFCSS